MRKRNVLILVALFLSAPGIVKAESLPLDGGVCFASLSEAKNVKEVALSEAITTLDDDIGEGGFDITLQTKIWRGFETINGVEHETVWMTDQNGECWIQTIGY